MTPPRNPEAWQTLRRDKRSAATVLLVIIAAIAALLALLGLLLSPSHTADRANPLYWALLLPFAWWAASLANYTPWATKTLRPAAAIATATALISLVLAANTQQSLTPWIIAALIATPCAALGALLYPNTVLARTR